VALPPRAGFDAVSGMLGARCGALTCHGSAGRNLRLYHVNGRRLSAFAISGEGETTTAEHDANYLSVVSLEPELMSAVVSAGGADADRLTLVRKSRGEEAHAGTWLLVAGGAADGCLRSWLAGAVDEPLCAAGAEIARPY